MKEVSIILSIRSQLYLDHIAVLVVRYMYALKGSLTALIIRKTLFYFLLDPNWASPEEVYTNGFTFVVTQSC